MQDDPAVEPLRDIAVIGASAGGVEALRRLFAYLPSGYRGALFVVLHIAPGVTSVLGDILDRAGPLAAAAAVDGEAIEAGRAYVAPPDHQLLLDATRVSVPSVPDARGHHPAIDPLFGSAAAAFGPRVAGVVLSGTGEDGSAGLLAIAAAGGMTLVQDPAEAQFPAMPASALRAVPAARVERLDGIAAALATAAGGRSEGLTVAGR